jgi:hypothetical protein
MSDESKSSTDDVNVSRRDMLQTTTIVATAATAFLITETSAIARISDVTIDSLGRVLIGGAAHAARTFRTERRGDLMKSA